MFRRIAASLNRSFVADAATPAEGKACHVGSEAHVILTSTWKGDRALKMPAIATTKQARAKEALEAFSSNYLDCQYQFVDFFVDQLADISTQRLALVWRWLAGSRCAT
jgi:hypothetical protein